MKSVTELVRQTGENGAPNLLERTRPELAQLALMLLADGRGVRAIARETGLDAATVTALRRRQQEWVEAERDKQMVVARAVASKLIEAVYEEAERMVTDPDARAKTGLRNLSVAAGIWIDKAEKLADRPDQVAMMPHNVPSLDRLREAMDEVRSEIRVEGR